MLHFPRYQCLHASPLDGRLVRDRYERVQKNDNILRKNAIFNEHPVDQYLGIMLTLKIAVLSDIFVGILLEFNTME